METLNLIAGVFACAIFLLAGLPLLHATRNHRRGMRTQVILFVVALMLRFGLAMALYGGGLVALIGDDDSIGWLGGLVKMEEWEQDGVSLFDLPIALLGALQGVNRGYPYLVGAFVFVIQAPYRLPVASLSCFCGALTVVMIYRIADELFSPWVASRAGWCACVIPSLVIWSSQTVKEPIVILLETLLVYVCMRLQARDVRPVHVVAGIGSIVALVTLRFYAAYVGSVMVGFSLLVPRFERRGLSFPMALRTMVALVPMAVVTQWLLQREIAASQTFDLEYISTLKNGLATTADSGVLMDYDMTTWNGFVMATVVGAAHLLLAPFPWQWGNASLRMMLALPELLLWWLLVFAGVIPGFIRAVRERLGTILPLLLLLSGLGMLYSVTFGNIGLVYRQRAQLMPTLLIFAMAGFERWSFRRKAKASQPAAPAPAPTRPRAMTSGRRP